MAPSTATTKRVQGHPTLGDLYSASITCLDDVLPLLDHSAFLAIDTEFIFAIRDGQYRGSVLHQVGIAYATGLTLPTYAWRTSNRPKFKDFIQRNQVTASAININLTAEEQKVVRKSNKGKIPFRKTADFCKEQECSSEELDDRMESLVRLSKQDASIRGKDLVLVLFSHGAEWTYLSRHFPSIAQYFTSWMDVQQLAKANTFRSHPPHLNTCLNLYGYHWMDLSGGASRVTGEDHEGQKRHANADNAGQDACYTLALLDGLLDPDFRQRLAKRQAMQAIVHSSETPPPRERFVAIFESANKQRLPERLSKGYKAARYFWDLELKSLGVEHQANGGWVSFRSEEHLDRFVERYNNALVGGEPLKVVRVDREEPEFRAEEEMQQRQMEQKRQERKTRRDGNVEAGAMEITDLFAS
ncbi:hypothetical protein PG993_007922 [Apiospora rasikravindrae]|uniref:Uncharacterized protein n=1 Tax=Apiospora rasikravindrae TaxID=990691 RepID=A0ABR1SYW7_9PEZI